MATHLSKLTELRADGRAMRPPTGSPIPRRGPRPSATTRRTSEAELAENVVELQAADRLGRLYAGERLGEAPPEPTVCPFLGLATFDADHAKYFFGRERLVAELVARLVGAPLLAVVGRPGAASPRS